MSEPEPIIDNEPQQQTTETKMEEEPQVETYIQSVETQE